eukprot:gene24468-20845_t
MRAGAALLAAAVTGADAATTAPTAVLRGALPAGDRGG